MRIAVVLAGLGQLVFNDSYAVVAHFADSGGIFQGAEVSYRGVSVGRVSNMTLTAKGVDVTLDITNHALKIPSLTRAVVADRSAVGEQYVDLQPETDRAPYLHNGSQIPQQMTSTPISTQRRATWRPTRCTSASSRQRSPSPRSSPSSPSVPVCRERCSTSRSIRTRTPSPATPG